MKIFWVLLFFLASFACVWAAPYVHNFGLYGQSYMQRGVFKFGETELVLNVFVKAQNGCAQMSIKCEGANFASVKVSNSGEILEVKGSQFLPEYLAKKYAAKDFLVCLGYAAAFPQRCTISEKNGKTTLKAPNNIYEFESQNGQIKSVYIENPNYKITLKTVKIF